MTAKEEAKKIFDEINNILSDVDTHHSLDSEVKRISIFHVKGILNNLDTLDNRRDFLDMVIEEIKLL